MRPLLSRASLMIGTRFANENINIYIYFSVCGSPLGSGSAARPVFRPRPIFRRRPVRWLRTQPNGERAWSCRSGGPRSHKSPGRPGCLVRGMPLLQVIASLAGVVSTHGIGRTCFECILQLRSCRVVCELHHRSDTLGSTARPFEACVLSPLPGTHKSQKLHFSAWRARRHRRPFI